MHLPRYIPLTFYNSVSSIDIEGWFILSFRNQLSTQKKCGKQLGLTNDVLFWNLDDVNGIIFRRQ